MQIRGKDMLFNTGLKKDHLVTALLFNLNLQVYEHEIANYEISIYIIEKETYYINKRIHTDLSYRYEEIVKIF